MIIDRLSILQECPFYTTACSFCTTCCFGALPCPNSSADSVIKTGSFLFTLIVLNEIAYVWVQSTFKSGFSLKQPMLRHLAVSTVRHLIEKDPVSSEDMCSFLFFPFANASSLITFLDSCIDGVPCRFPLLMNK